MSDTGYDLRIGNVWQDLAIYVLLIVCMGVVFSGIGVALYAILIDRPQIHQPGVVTGVVMVLGAIVVMQLSARRMTDPWREGRILAARIRPEHLRNDMSVVEIRRTEPVVVVPVSESDIRMTEPTPDEIVTVSELPPDHPKSGV